MSGIAKPDKGERYYHRTDEQLAGFAAWRPEFAWKAGGISEYAYKAICVCAALQGQLPLYRTNGEKHILKRLLHEKVRSCHQ